MNSRPKSLIYFLIIGAIIMLSSCGPRCTQDLVENAMKEWYKKPLVYNDSLPLMLPNTEEPVDTVMDWFPDPNGFYIIRQVDAGCSKCIDQMEMAQSFLKKHADIDNLHFILVIDAAIPDVAQDALDKLQIDFPVFFQQNHEQMRQANGLAINDDLFKNILVNGQGEILLFGDPLLNELTEELFLSIAMGECGI